jgi:hypothetical protein
MTREPVSYLRFTRRDGKVATYSGGGKFSAGKTPRSGTAFYSAKDADEAVKVARTIYPRMTIVAVHGYRGQYA